MPNQDTNLKSGIRDNLRRGTVYEFLEQEIKNGSVLSTRESNLLHGKMYHIANNGVEKAIMGSSNFTMRGLGLIQESSNIELNLEVDSDRDRRDLKAWFDEIWDDDKLVEDVKEQVLAKLAQMEKDHAPELIYYKTLYELFRDEIETRKTNDQTLEDAHPKPPRTPAILNW